MRIVFMGTPDFAVPSLLALSDAEDMEVCLVVSQPDRKRSRNKFSPTPVKEAALSRHLPVLTPEKLNQPDVFEKIEALRPDLLVVIAYGQMIGKPYLTHFHHRIVNIHGSLLPEYRGAAPIQRAMLDGADETGLTSMLIEREMDAGPMLDTRRTRIEPEDDIESLTQRLSEMAAELLLDTLRHWPERLSAAQEQPKDGVTFAAKIEKSDGQLDFEGKGRRLLDQVRALRGWPGAWFVWQGQVYKVHRAHLGARRSGAANGEVWRSDAEGIAVNCADASFVIDVIQAPNRKAMPVSDYLRGNRLEIGANFSREAM
ncbi:MAG: methionyl-tRNA formyltransferase [Ndongobacter sp.]|nr:methionyl-tRNA formyltransferase [Ndongobacter sp.]